MTTRHVLCASCDVQCMLQAEVPDTGSVGDVRVKAMDPRPLHTDICMKGVHSPLGLSDEKRVLHPLRRTGARGSGQWRQVSWDEALDDIARRLRAVVDEYGPEAFAVSGSPAILQNDSGMTRRFMNLIGSPNFISGVAVCMGNTAAVNRLVYGWFAFPDYANTHCIVLFGHDPRPHSWTPIYNAIRRAQERGAKLIVVDPRKSENARRADLWLPIAPGSDAALCFGWLKVILDEGLYDRDFVENWVVGFDSFRARVDEFPLERVAALTGLAPNQITEAARLYATAGPSVIPWTPITDQQRNSTSAIRLQCALRALCGYLDVPGGETLQGVNPDILSESELELHERLPAATRAIQLGADRHPVFTYRAMERLCEPTRRVWGHEWVNFVCGSYMAHPSAVFRAMAEGEPYPVRAFFALANNPLLSYPNMQLVYRGLMKQDLFVAFEQFRSPSAQLADYILPSDSWLERPALLDAYGWTAIYRTSRQIVEPPKECRGIYQVWKGLADRMGLEDDFPWASLEALYAHRLGELGDDFDTFAAGHPFHAGPFSFRKYEQTGFATPSGKVELASSLLEELGFDPLPYWRDDPVEKDFPQKLFIGVREDEFFQTCHRHIERLRTRNPEPRFFVAPADAAAAGLTEGGWAQVVTSQGHVRARVAIDSEMPPGLIRVPHGWWQPERAEGDGSLSGAWEYADSQICPDDEANIDREQGVPQLKGLACRIEALETPPS